MTNIERLNHMASCWTLDHVMEQLEDLFDDCEGEDIKNIDVSFSLYELKLLYDAVKGKTNDT